MLYYSFLTSYTVLTGLALLFLPLVYLCLFRNASKKFRYPVLEQPPDGDWSPILKAASARYPDEPFIFPLDPPYVVLPHSMIGYIKDLPDERASLSADLSARFHGKYSGIGHGHDELIPAVKKELTQSIASIIGDIQDEAKFAFGKELSSTTDWTENEICRPVASILSRVGARIFVGQPLCRDEKWLAISMQYLQDIMEVALGVDQYLPLLQPIVAPFLSQSRRIRKTRRSAGEMIAPYVKGLLEKRQWRGNESFQAGNTNEIRSESMSGWLLNHNPNIRKDSTSLFLGDKQVRLAMINIQGVSLVVIHALLNLSTWPEFIPELRTEIEEVIAEEGGKLSRGGISKMKKLDSFIQETQRCNPTLLGVLNRRVMDPKGLDLPNGQHLPFGTHIIFINPYHPGTSGSPPPGPLTALGQPPLNEFHPFRFSEIRKQPGEENKHQLVIPSSEQIAFGLGHSACPGRFFAGVEIKVLLIELIRTFDFALGAGGEGEAEGHTRPATLALGVGYAVDPSAKIYLRKRV